MKILVADDRPATRFALRKKIQSWGFDVVEAADGNTALEILQGDDPPRIAILDWMMPGIDGVDICRKLHEDKKGAFIYTILLTSKNEREDLVFALESGAHNFQTKPFSPEELHAHVNVGCRLVVADDKLKEYAAEMERLATLDFLTGVFNRRYFMEYGDKEVTRAQRYMRELAVLMIDVDHFKAINDTYGHSAGDEVLKSVAGHCEDILRDHDVFGRIGGEEFGVVLPETSLDAAVIVAQRLRDEINNLKICYEGQEIKVTCSIGVAESCEADKLIEDALKRADTAMYEAKEAGRDQVRVFQSQQPPTEFFVN